MDLLGRIREILDSKEDAEEVAGFLSDVRESLAASNRQFIVYQVLLLASLVTYYLVVYTEGTFSFNSIKVIDRSLFQRVFLLVPAALLCAQAAIGYLRRIQRETYDLLQIARCRVLGRTGLHELRLPADYILGLFVLRNEGGRAGFIIGNVGAFLGALAFVIGPAMYIGYEAVRNIEIFGVRDVLSSAISVMALVLCFSGLGIMRLSRHVKAEAVELSSVKRAS